MNFNKNGNEKQNFCDNDLSYEDEKNITLCIVGNKKRP